MIPTFIDLRELAEHLKGDPKLRRLLPKIERAARIQSCYADLGEAWHCLQALAELRDGKVHGSPTALQMFESASLMRAVQLYERATSAGAKKNERGSIQIRERLTPEQRKDHDSLVRLRQRAIAHVYTGETVGGETWHRSRIFAVECSEGWRTASATQRMHFDGETFQRCIRQVPVAQSIIDMQFLRELDELTGLLNDAGVSDATLRSHSFDPVATFGSEEAAKAVVSSATDRTLSFITREER